MSDHLFLYIQNLTQSSYTQNTRLHSKHLVTLKPLSLTLSLTPQNNKPAPLTEDTRSGVRKLQTPYLAHTGVRRILWWLLLIRILVSLLLTVLTLIA